MRSLLNFKESLSPLRISPDAGEGQNPKFDRILDTFSTDLANFPRIEIHPAEKSGLPNNLTSRIMLFFSGWSKPGIGFDNLLPMKPHEQSVYGSQEEKGNYGEKIIRSGDTAGLY